MEGGRIMALKITKEGNIIKVVETLCSWHHTNVTTILYDMENKKKKGGNDPWYPMTQSDIDWVTKYYLPKVEQ